MRLFAELYQALDASTATGDKVRAPRRYFAAAPAADAAWAVYFLAGGKPRQVVPTALLRQQACRLAGIDDWLFDASYQAVGDLAETIAHVLPAPTRASRHGLAFWVEERLLPLRGLAPEVQAAREGLMLKQRAARYGGGRTKSDGSWWKWKVDPLSVDCVLVYAQAGHGRRASVYTDYTFAVWNRPPADAAEAQAAVEAIARREPAQDGALQLVAFAKAYSGLTDEEFRAVDGLIRGHTLEKFGPVRSVKPSLVFALGFEGINASPRHKSGIAVRFPRMLRIRDDKPLHEADSLHTLRRLMAGA